MADRCVYATKHTGSLTHLHIQAVYADVLTDNTATSIYYAWIRLFRTYCICLYGAALWTSFATESLNKFRRCYHKSIKMFFWVQQISQCHCFSYRFEAPQLSHHYA